MLLTHFASLMLSRLSLFSIIPESRLITSERFRLFNTDEFTIVLSPKRLTASIVQFTSSSVSTMSDIFDI